ncbi:hypothetical protein K501DRAFT_268981 [Backusella circina FSU 941]|nr:hypothetical protein K501DRAFT_268981 [Backusella circina FSU 941]
MAITVIFSIAVFYRYMKIVKTRKVRVNSIIIESFNSFWLQRLEEYSAPFPVCHRSFIDASIARVLLWLKGQNRFYYKASTSFGFQQPNIGLCQSRSARNGICSW